MFDLPKAAHFTISQAGKQLPPNNDFGLNVRWGIASACRDAGVCDMLNLSLADRITIGKICDRENRRMETIDCVVQLRLNYSEIPNSSNLHSELSGNAG